MDDDKKVEVSESTLNSLMDEVKELRKKVDNSSSEVIPMEGEEERFVRVVEHEGRPVSDIRNPHQVKVTDKGESVMLCDIDVLQKDGKIKEIKGVDYHDLRRRDSSVCKLIDVKILNKIVKGSQIDEQRIDDEGIRHKTGRKVRLISVNPQMKYTVEWKGEEIVLDNVNISGN